MEEELSFNQLLSRLGSNDKLNRKNAIKKLEGFKDKNLMEHIFELLRETDEREVKKRVLETISWFDDLSAVKPLIVILNDEEDIEVRICIIQTLAKLKANSALPELLKIVNRDHNPDVIREASLAIQIIQGITPAYF
jgi:HEAT repeat protein